MPKSFRVKHPTEKASPASAGKQRADEAHKTTARGRSPEQPPEDTIAAGGVKNSVVVIGRSDSAPALPADHPRRAPEPPASSGPPPDADTLFAAYLPGWRDAVPLADGNFSEPLHPLRQQINKPDHRPLATKASYYATPALREALASFTWGVDFLRTSSVNRYRDQRDAQHRKDAVYKRGARDPLGRTSQSPTGALLDYARWISRKSEADELQAGRYQPHFSLIPPGAEPPIYANALEDALAVLHACALYRAVGERIREYPHLRCWPYPRWLDQEVARRENEAKADLRVVRNILSALPAAREWSGLLEVDLDHIVVDEREVDRAIWTASSAALERALAETGVHPVASEYRSLGTGDAQPRGSWIRPSAGWWQAARALERAARRAKLERLRNDLLQAPAWRDDATASPAHRTAAFTARVALETRLGRIEDELAQLNETDKEQEL